MKNEMFLHEGIDADLLPHRRETRRRAAWALVVFWLYVNISTQLRELFDDVPMEWVRTIVSETIFTAAGVVLSIAIYLVLERLERRSLALLGAIVVLAAVGAAQIHFAIYFAVFGEFFELPEAIEVQRTYALIFWSHFYIAWGATMLALLYSGRSRAEQRMRANAEAVTHRARMLALRYQLNPHFLFNALNSVAALVLDRKAEPAERMVRRLSSFLRRGLGENPLTQIRLEKEIKHQLDYLSIETDRFSDRMATEIDIPDDLLDALVPGFILQPLIENTIKHGVSSTTQKVTIAITARGNNDKLELIVSEDSQPAERRPSDGAGIGTKNVRERLHELYGEAARFSSGPLKGGGYSTRILIPLTRAAAPAEEAGYG